MNPHDMDQQDSVPRRKKESKSTMEPVPSTEPRTPFEVRNPNLQWNKYLQQIREHHSKFGVQTPNGINTYDKTENTQNLIFLLLLHTLFFCFATMETVPPPEPRTHLGVRSSNPQWNQHLQTKRELSSELQWNKYLQKNREHHSKFGVQIYD